MLLLALNTQNQWSRALIFYLVDFGASGADAAQFGDVEEKAFAAALANAVELISAPRKVGVESVTNRNKTSAADDDASAPTLAPTLMPSQAPKMIITLATALVIEGKATLVDVA